MRNLVRFLGSLIPSWHLLTEPWTIGALRRGFYQPPEQSVWAGGEEDAQDFANDQTSLVPRSFYFSALPPPPPPPSPTSPYTLDNPPPPSPFDMRPHFERIHLTHLPVFFFCFAFFLTFFYS